MDDARCPFCKRLMRVYKRPITTTAAGALILLWKDYKVTGVREYKYLERFLKLVWPGHTRGDETKLVHWGLLESEVGHRNGKWRITEKGIHFVEGLEVPRFAYIDHNNECLGFSDGNYTPSDMINIVSALNTPFDKEKLLSGDWTPPRSRK
jgi:hypothetical protein